MLGRGFHLPSVTDAQVEQLRSTTQRLYKADVAVDGGKITTPKGGEVTDLTQGCFVVPVLRTAGGVWIPS